MAVKLSNAVRAKMLDAIETEIAASAHLRLLTGTVPADCAAAETGTLLIDIPLPSDWMAAGNTSNGTKGKAGAWSGNVSTGGTATYFRIVASAGTPCGFQGTVGLGSGDLSLDNNVLAGGQLLTITAFDLTGGNA